MMHFPLLLLFQATDADEPNSRNSEVTYRLVDTFPPNVHSKFSVGQKTAEISLNSPLDYEKIKSIILHIVASDDGNPKLTATTTVTIAVIDRNDEEPIFNPSQYSASVAENSTIG